MDTALIGILEKLGAGAGIIVVLVILGLLVPRWVVNDLKHEIKDLKAALKSERERGDAAVAAMQASNDVLRAVRTGVQMGLEQRATPPAEGTP